MASSFFKVNLKSYLLQYRDKLNKRKNITFIVPTWLGAGYGFVAFFLILAGYLYQSNFLFLYVFFVTSLGLVVMFSANRNVKNVKIVRAFHQADFCNLKQNVTVQFDTSSQGYQLRSQFAFSSETDQSTVSESSESQLMWKPSQMGWQKAPLVTLESSYPFGFFRVWKNLQIESLYFVLPEAIDHFAKLMSAGNDKSSTLNNKKLVDELEFEGHKEYQQGDRVSRIDWKASSKIDRLLVKKFKDFDESPQVIAWSDTESLSEFKFRAEQMAHWCSEARSKSPNSRILFSENGTDRFYELSEMVNFFKNLFEIYKNEHFS